jgi:peptidoglycan hydrolase-like protein with peptidoglycan-binding domain
VCSIRHVKGVSMSRLRAGRIGLVGVALVIALVAAACGGGDDDSVNAGGGGSTTTTAASYDGGSDGGDGNDVLALQRELSALGCNPGPLDGSLGPDTEGAIRLFQQAAGLTVDGIVGPRTRASLTGAAQLGQPRCPDTPPPPPPTSAPPTTSGGGGGGGTPPCTEAAIRPVVQASLNPGEQMFKLNQFNCAITWAVSTPTVGTTQQNAVEITVLLRWNQSAWQVVDRGVYCDNGEVPAAIYQEACESN